MKKLLSLFLMFIIALSSITIFAENVETQTEIVIADTSTDDTHNELAASSELTSQEITSEEADGEDEFSSRNPIEITDLKIIYSADFYINNMTSFTAPSGAVGWGICAYKNTNTSEEIKKAFFEVGKTTYLADIPDDKSNIIRFMLNSSPSREIVYQDDKFYECDTATEFPVDFELQLTVTKAFETKLAAFNVFIDGSVVAEEIDMSTFNESGRLPEEYFLPNKKTREELFSDYRAEFVSNVSKYINERSYILLDYATAGKLYVEKYYVEQGELEAKTEAVNKFFNSIFNMLESGMTECNHSAESLKGYHQEKAKGDKMLYIRLVTLASSTVGKVPEISLEMYDSHIVFQDQAMEFDTTKTKEIIDYALSAYEQDLSCLSFDGKSNFYDLNKENETVLTIDKENRTMTVNGVTSQYEYVEKMEFDIKNNTSYFPGYDTVYNEVANSDEEIHCTVEQYFLKKMYYVLTLEGSKGKKQFVCEISKLGSMSTMDSNPLKFYADYVVQDNKFVLLKNVRGLRKEFINVDCRVGWDKQPIVSIKLGPAYSGMTTVRTPSLISGYNFKYEYFWDSKQLGGVNNLYYAFGLRSAEEYKDLLRNMQVNEGLVPPPQNPEAYVAYHKSSGITYTINYIAEIPLNITGSSASAWLNGLGSDVKAYLVSFKRIVEGTPWWDYTMIKFEGTQGSIWFEDSETIFSDEANEEGNLLISNSYNSLISFDGVKLVKNTVNFETINTGLVFSPEGDKELKEITIIIDSKEYSVSAEDIKYIGGIANYGSIY